MDSCFPHGDILVWKEFSVKIIILFQKNVIKHYRSLMCGEVCCVGHASLTKQVLAPV